MTWVFKQIKPQKARGVLQEEMWRSLEWLAEEKYDGDRRVAQFMGGGIVRFTGTRESVDGTGFVEKTQNVPQLSYSRLAAYKHSVSRVELERARGLAGTVLDGEMITPFGTSSRSRYVTSVMGSSPEEAVRKQVEGGYLCYAVFDCLWYRGRDIRHEALRVRRNFTEQAVREWGNGYVTVAPQTAGLGKRALYDSVLGRGGEGVVLKRFDAPYGAENLWVKVKAKWTADVVITGFEPAKEQSKKVGGKISRTKYAGGVGAIAFSQWRYGKLVPYGTCSGFDDQLRGMFGHYPRDWIGKVIEIEHCGRESDSGAFRHPQFKRFRIDKESHDCVYREDET